MGHPSCVDNGGAARVVNRQESAESGFQRSAEAPHIPKPGTCGPPVGCFGQSLGSGRLGLAVALTDVLPRNSQSVQDEVIVEAELGRIQDGLPSTHHMGILRDAPGLVADHAITMLASGLGGVTIAVEPGT